MFGSPARPGSRRSPLGRCARSPLVWAGPASGCYSQPALSAVYIALAIASLGFLIVVHEGGHYFVARWCKMRIERFSIGFGPGILKWKSKKTQTTFQLAPIPFGGFVEIKGMNIAEDVDP